jgi:hypothetical protein
VAAVAAFLARPGVKSSEFKVLAALTAWLGVNASTHTVSLIQSVLIALPGIVYALARGFAKTEVRGGAAPAPPAGP